MDYDEAIAVFFASAPPGVGAPRPVSAAAPARRLRDAYEPLSMHAVWSRRVNEALAVHGYDFFTAYVTGRAAPLGAVPSPVVAATFAVFDPGTIDAIWTGGLGLLPLPELIALRDRETAASLREILSPVADDAEVERMATTLEQVVDGLDGTGRVLFSALRSQPRLGDPYARLWRATDLLREHRGDGHVAACIAAGLDPVRMGILNEVWVDYPVGEYSGTRAWAEQAAAAGLARLEADGLVADGAITEEGRRFRDGIEATTDATQQAVVDALGGELDALAKRLDALSQCCIDQGAFPPDPRKRAAG
ncbi:MAG: hypothetical protein AB7J32_24095 [Pseudonocardia sp.]